MRVTKGIALRKSKKAVRSGCDREENRGIELL